MVLPAEQTFLGYIVIYGEILNNIRKQIDISLKIAKSCL